MKCLLIVSQYYHSYHYFVAERTEDNDILYSSSRSFIEELEGYKRSDETKTKSYNYGDICEKYFDGLKTQRNVNDSGDIYFVPCDSIEIVLHELKYYQDMSRRQSAGYKRKAVIEAIGKHHNQAMITRIVKNYFTLL